MGLFGSLFKSYSEKQINKIMPLVNKIEALSDKYAALTDEEMRACTDELKARLNSGETLNDILPDAFALVREADFRVLGKRPFRVQLMGGIILHQGRIAEMKTGEGKTLVATLPAYLNALSGKGVHIVTVNDYLARRDSEEMGKVFKFLGLTVGLVIAGMTTEEKKSAYNADITYGMNSEFGFDYLRDNTMYYPEYLVGRNYDFAIIDEVDSILIDEAKTPLVISRPTAKATKLYERADMLVRPMRAKVLIDAESKEDISEFEEHFVIDESTGFYALMDKSVEDFVTAFSLDASEDLLKTAYYGIALTEDGKYKLTSNMGFNDEDFEFSTEDSDDGEYFFSNAGRKRAEATLNRVITTETRAGETALTKHGKNKLVKFFDFEDDMFIKDKERDTYQIINKAKGHVIKQLGLSERDFTEYERNFRTNEKLRTADFLELGKQNAKDFFGFSDEDFISIGADAYALSSSGYEKMKKSFALTPKDFTEENTNLYHISKQSIAKVRELFARDMIIDERAGVVRLTTLATAKLKRLFALSDKHIRINPDICTAGLERDGYLKIKKSYKITKEHFRAVSEGLYALTDEARELLDEYTELSANDFIRVSDNEYCLSDDGIRDIKRMFSLSDEELSANEKSAFLTEHGARKLNELFDVSQRGFMLIDKKAGYYSFSRAAALEFSEAMGMDETAFTNQISSAASRPGFYMYESIINKIKSETPFVENTDFIYMPKVGYFTEKGIERMISLFELPEDGLIERGDEMLLSRDAAKLFRRIFALDSLYSPLPMTKLGIERLEAAINFDYVVNEKKRRATLTKLGIEKAEKFFEIENIADPENAEILHHVQTAVNAYGTMKRDVHYVVKDDEVCIVDQSTGRLLAGRRFNEGLHQAIEAKEKVKIKNEDQTTATITYQNFFRMYRKLSGMTGTALTEENEFRDIYSLDVVAVPTNRPMIRKDHKDLFFTTRRGKLGAILTQIITCYKKGQPVLVGTTSVEKSEELSRLLHREKIPHNVLNAKEHKNEAMIVAEAGMPGAVTISTNMAGRGTDIKLGGNPEIIAMSRLKKALINHKGYASRGPEFIEYLIQNADSSTNTEDPDILFAREEYERILEECITEIEPKCEAVKAAGGLFVIGTERHESRRIDNQLSGRSGRQGDVGESRFFNSFEDDMWRLSPATRNFAGTTMRLGFDENTPISLGMISALMEKAQKAREAAHFSVRKNLLSYDDVVNEQRGVIYKLRRSILESGEITEKLEELIRDGVRMKFDECFLAEERAPADFAKFFNLVLTDGIALDYTDEEFNELDLDELREEYANKAVEIFQRKRSDAKRAKVSPDAYKDIPEGSDLYNKIMDIPTIALDDYMKTRWLLSIDKEWIEHLEQMEDLKNYVGLNSYAQRNPLTEYKLEGAQMFGEMMREIKTRTARLILTSKLSQQMIANSHDVKMISREIAETYGVTINEEPSKNALCPCGSGKKYKHCCLNKKNRRTNR